jgi:hypothetical protein
MLVQGGVVTMSLLSRSCSMWLFVVGTCERTSVGNKIWSRRWYQCCCHCLFTLSEKGWLHSCNWSFTM